MEQILAALRKALAQDDALRLQAIEPLDPEKAARLREAISKVLSGGTLRQAAELSTASDKSDPDPPPNPEPEPIRAHAPTIGGLRARLQQRLGADVVDTWFRPLEIEGFDGAVVRLSVPVKFLREWLTTHYRADLLEACRAEFPGAQGFDLVLRQPGSPARRVTVVERTARTRRRAAPRTDSREPPVATEVRAPTHEERLQAARAAYLATPEGRLVRETIEAIARMTPEDMRRAADEGAALSERMLRESAKEWVRKK